MSLFYLYNEKTYNFTYLFYFIINYKEKYV